MMRKDLEDQDAQLKREKEEANQTQVLTPDEMSFENRSLTVVEEARCIVSK